MENEGLELCSVLARSIGTSTCSMPLKVGTRISKKNTAMKKHLYFMLFLNPEFNLFVLAGKQHLNTNCQEKNQSFRHDYLS